MEHSWLWLVMLCVLALPKNHVAFAEYRWTFGHGQRTSGNIESSFRRGTYGHTFLREPRLLRTKPCSGQHSSTGDMSTEQVLSNLSTSINTLLRLGVTRNFIQRELRRLLSSPALERTDERMNKKTTAATNTFDTFADRVSRLQDLTYLSPAGVGHQSPLGVGHGSYSNKQVPPSQPERPPGHVYTTRDLRDYADRLEALQSNNKHTPSGSVVPSFGPVGPPRYKDQVVPLAPSSQQTATRHHAQVRPALSKDAQAVLDALSGNSVKENAPRTPNQGNRVDLNIQESARHVPRKPPIQGILVEVKLPDGTSFDQEVALSPSLNIYNAIYQAAMSQDYDEADGNPFDINIAPDLTRRCYVIESIVGIEKDHLSRWLLTVTGPEREIVYTGECLLPSSKVPLRSGYRILIQYGVPT